MKLEQVLPMLRDGKCITRTKPYNQSSTVLFLKIEDSKLKFKIIWTSGDVINWADYRIRAEDVMSDDWEIAG
jgi:hypothetical protein